MITQAEASAKYGQVLGANWFDKDKWLVMYDVPADIQPFLINTVTGKPTTKICCNRDMMPMLDLAFQYVMERSLHASLKSFDGCWNVRFVRGSLTDISAHSWGIAIDLNAATNKLGDVDGDMTPALVACFKDAGFTWGGDFSRCDKMHFSLGF